MIPTSTLGSSSTLPRVWRWGLTVAVLFLSAGCSGAPSRPSAPARGISPRPAQLVVVVVYDQVGTWVLEKYLPYLDEHGLVRSTMARGATVWNAKYAYAGTYTAPGHAAIYTGAPPAISGVAANKVWDRARQRRVSAADDARHHVFGDDATYASPEVLRVDTVGDVLRAATRDAAHVVAISMKDRSAVLPGGHHPDMAVWYDLDAHGFTTSTYYAEQMPAWLAQWNVASPTSSRFEDWTPEDPLLLARVLGPDDAPGEGDWLGFGRTFPHRVTATTDPYDVFTATPMAAEHLVALARSVVTEYRLGEDATTDLLAISVSNTDYVGHTFGADSWEAMDDLIRTDRVVGSFVNDLRRRHDVAVLITADHGVAPLVERSLAAAHDAHRLLPSDVRDALEGACEARLGPGPWVEAFGQPFVYLPERVRSGPDRARVMAIVLPTLRALPGVYGAWDVRDAERLRASDDAIEHAVGLSIDPEPRGDVFVAPAEHSLVDEEVPRGFGTSHGTPWDYDTHVPVIFAGPHVEHLETRNEVAQSRVAATIAELLGVPAEFATQCARDGREVAHPLPGAPQVP